VDTPFWLDEPASPVEADSQGPVDVIGAGITGCACALQLAGGGLRVRVHDARGIAEGGNLRAYPRLAAASGASPEP
jgi:2-polyprenyl-6-methoxyphenol hydroxylase-like FAD-dependent oxidoreductase